MEKKYKFKDIIQRQPLVWVICNTLEQAIKIRGEDCFNPCYELPFVVYRTRKEVRDNDGRLNSGFNTWRGDKKSSCYGEEPILFEEIDFEDEPAEFLMTN